MQDQMRLEKTGDLQVLSYDKQIYYRISYKYERDAFVSWFRREYGVLRPVDLREYDLLTHKLFEIFKWNFYSSAITIITRAIIAYRW